MSMDRALANLWCDRIPPRTEPAVQSVVGVFSTHTRIEMRRAIRHSWLPSVEPANAATQFVLRGLDLDDSTVHKIVAESNVWRDLVLVNASSTLPRSIGPTLSLLRWCACAPRLYPTARFIGKYDDDVWVNGPAMSAVLRMVLRAIDLNASDTQPEGEAIIGRLETYHWYFGSTDDVSS